MKTAKHIWSTIFSIVVVNLAVAEESTWLTDFEAAKRIAAEKNIPILANFSGSDWCGWCMKLNREVFSRDEFRAYAKENLILFVADFPRKTSLDPKTTKQNRALAETYKIEGFPTVLILGSSGDVLATTGYRPDGAKAYVEYLRQIVSAKR